MLAVPRAMGGYQQNQSMGGSGGASGGNASNAVNYLGFSASSMPQPQASPHDHHHHHHQNPHQQQQQQQQHPAFVAPSNVNNNTNALTTAPSSAPGSKLPIWRDIDVKLPVAGDLKVRTEAADFVWSGKVPGRLRVVFEPSTAGAAMAKATTAGRDSTDGADRDAEGDNDAEGVVVDDEDDDGAVDAANGVVVQWSSVNGV
ncbi:hypothetical protein IWZ03DRAFT_366272 [Phyllosticta citriasiana]|uniref:Uncharacterized protein n=2 Tax=Phyllosticta citriasiana TaxID=595635 RepID=A0ABR1L0H5_9PEZI